MKTYGYKLLREDGTSINGDYPRVAYPLNEWVEVPGNGAYVALSDGLSSGGIGPVLALLECEEPTGADAPDGVKCFRKVRRLPLDGWIKHWGGSLDLRSLTSVPEGFKLPEIVEGWLDLRGLTSVPEGFKLPESVGSSLDLSGLTSVPEGFKLPEIVGGWLDLRGLTSVPEGFKLPESVGSSLYLNGLTSVSEGFKLPEIVGGWLDLRGLTSVPEGFKLPESVGSSLDLSGLGIGIVSLDQARATLELKI